MKYRMLSLILALAPFSTPLLASHVPSIEVTIDGNAARFIKPELFFNDEQRAIELFKYEGVFMAEDVVAGSYTLTLIDKDKGTVLLVEPMSLKPMGSHHVSGNTRHIACSFRSGAIECANYY